jgi:hypothetical protein
VITRFRKIKRRRSSNIKGIKGLITGSKDGDRGKESKKELLKNRGWSSVRTERVIGKILGIITCGVAGGASTSASNILSFFFRLCRVKTGAVSV